MPPISFIVQGLSRPPASRSINGGRYCITNDTRNESCGASGGGHLLLFLPCSTQRRGGGNGARTVRARPGRASSAAPAGPSGAVQDSGGEPRERFLSVPFLWERKGTKAVTVQAPWVSLVGSGGPDNSCVGQKFCPTYPGYATPLIHRSGVITATRLPPFTN